jgi:Type III flagellar switch regulator (C-ring) FliN C-term
MLQSRDWLPNDAVAGAEVRSALETVIEGWSLHWFGERSLSIATMRGHAAGWVPSHSRAEWMNFGDGIHLDWSERTQMGIARHALDARPDMNAHSDDDRKLLNSFAFRIAKDLVQRLDQELKFGSVVSVLEDLQPSTDPFCPTGGVDLLIAADGAVPSIAVALETSALVPVRKATCAPFKAQVLEAFDLVGALGPSRIDFSIPVGAAQMSARELHGLAPGDVVILDHPVDRPLSLVSQATARPLFTAALNSDGQNLILTATEFEEV